jgi:hypothetical protein
MSKDAGIEECEVAFNARGEAMVSLRARGPVPASQLSVRGFTLWLEGSGFRSELLKVSGRVADRLGAAGSATVVVMDRRDDIQDVMTLPLIVKSNPVTAQTRRWSP